MMKNIQRFVIFLFITVMLSGSVSEAVFAAAPDHLDKVTVTFDDAKPGAAKLQKEVLYQTFDPYDDPLDHIEQTIIVNGDTYYLESVSEPRKVKTDKVIPDKGVWDSEPFAAEYGDEIDPEEIIEDENGYKVRLVKKELVETQVEERTEYKEFKYDFEGIDAATDIPEVLEAEIDDGRGALQTIKVKLPYIGSVVTDEYWDDDFSFNIKVTDYDKPVYDLDGTDVPNGADLNEYKEEFLRLLELDPDFYRISDIRWDGEEYESGGRICRNAVTSGSKLKKDVTATFGGDVTFPAVRGYIWRCEYEEILDEQYQNVYTMAVTVTFALDTPEETLSWWQQLWELIKGVIKAVYDFAAEQITEHPVRSSAILLLIAAVIVLLLLLGGRKTCKYDESIRCPYRRPASEQCDKCIYSHRGQKL